MILMWMNTRLLRQTRFWKVCPNFRLRGTTTGGLNLTFSQNVSPDILKALAVSYFKLGGLHIGISVINAETLKDTMKKPNKYKSFTVRLYGFSKYFVSLPKWQRKEVLNRTQYKAWFAKYFLEMLWENNRYFVWTTLKNLKHRCIRQRRQPR